MCALFILLARLPVNRRLSGVQFWEGSKVILRFLIARRGIGTPNPALFKGQLCSMLQNQQFQVTVCYVNKSQKVEWKVLWARGKICGFLGLAPSLN